MIKFYKVKDSEIRKAVVFEDENSKKVAAIIGQVPELLAKDIIFEDNTAGNEDKWLVIDSKMKITEFPSLDAAKEFCRKEWGN